MTSAVNVAVVLEPALPAEEAALIDAGLLVQAAKLAQMIGGELSAFSHEASEQYRRESFADRLAEALHADAPGIVLLAGTDAGRDLAPLLAFLLGTTAIVGCTDIRVSDGDMAFVRPLHGGAYEEEIRYAPDRVSVVALDTSLATCHSDSTLDASQELPTPRTVSSQAAPGIRSPRRLELVPPDFRTVAVDHAKRMLAIGSGATGFDVLPHALDFAELLQCSVGTTRPVVDDGLLPKERMVGQTGKRVAPDLYLALGISGSPHHVAGFEAAREVMAINCDVRAPIFQFSDSGFVGDLGVILPALIRMIEEWRDAAH